MSTLDEQIAWCRSHAEGGSDIAREVLATLEGMAAPGPVKIVDNRPQRLGWAPGNYLNKCRDCGCQFIGDKRALQCADCAYKAGDSPSPQQPTDVEIQDALKKGEEDAARTHSESRINPALSDIPLGPVAFFPQQPTQEVRGAELQMPPRRVNK